MRTPPRNDAIEFYCDLTPCPRWRGAPVCVHEHRRTRGKKRIPPRRPRRPEAGCRKPQGPGAEQYARQPYRPSRCARHVFDCADHAPCNRGRKDRAQDRSRAHGLSPGRPKNRRNASSSIFSLFTESHGRPHCRRSAAKKHVEAAAEIGALKYSKPRGTV